MIARLLPILIVIVAIGVSGFAAMALKKPTAPKLPEEHDAQHAAGSVSEAPVPDASSVGYFDFKRNFIIPVVDEREVEAIVLVRISLEMDREIVDVVAQREPRIRDAFIRTLLSLSHEGLFNRDITEPSVYTTLQDRLLETAKEVVDSSVTSVLLVDYARQER